MAQQPPQEIDFHHPFTPYSVQLDFMKTVYSVLSAGCGQIGILESPTGTGKSLSLICSAVTWLRNHKSSAHEASLRALEEKFKDEPPWLVEQLLRREREDLVRRWEEREERLEKIRAREQAQERRSAKRRKVEEGSGRKGPVDEDAEWLLDDYEGDDSRGSDPLSGLSAETRDLLSRIGLGGRKKREDEDDKLEEQIKIYYASRTHSQLSQFIDELRRPSFPSSFPKSLESKEKKPGSDKDKEQVKHLPLSSRQKLCINPSVARLGSLSAINDRCAELQQSKTKEKCPYLPGEESLSQTHQFRDTALATLPDIEDLYTLGKSLSVCPYYASRTAIPGSEIITLPYPLLLQKTARDALGIKLAGNIVIIDEAHNIIDAVSSANAAAIKLSELRRARQMLGVYVKRFGKKLKGENRAMVGRVGRVIEGLSEWLGETLKQKPEQGIVDSAALLRHKSVDQIDMYKLIQYIQTSKLAYKIESYVSHVEEESAGHPSTSTTPSTPSTTSTTSTTQQPKSSSPSTPVLHTLASFLLALTNLSFEGRIFFQKLDTPTATHTAATPQQQQQQQQSSPPDIQLSYLLLSPTHAFSDIASTARAVILAGGTMSPFDDYTAHLFPTLPAEKITTLSCSHVIPPSNICVWTLARTRTPAGGGDTTFEFSFQKRKDRSMIARLGLVLLNVCSVVPDGVVVFFPSYGYLDEVVQVWQGGSGVGEASLWERLGAKKPLFREVKGGSSDEVLEAYSSSIFTGDATLNNPNHLQPKPANPRGAILLSVIGGKMSEGINFSDRLARCILVVGLPYPNIHSPEWKARTEYIQSTTLARLLDPPASSSSTPSTITTSTTSPPPKMSKQQATALAHQASRTFYENACMRAVNQSIGRAIRHRADYASIVLVDARYAAPRIRDKLPGWIREGLVKDSHDKGLPQLMGALSGFFRSKKGV